MYENNREIYKMFHNGNVEGISIYDNEFCKKALASIKPVSINELKCVLALDSWYHPRKIDKTAEYVSGKGECPFFEGRIREILSSTRGMLMWKSQVHEILNYILGYDAHKTVQFRKDMGSRGFPDVEEKTKKFEEEFTKACTEKKICDKNDAMDFAAFIEERTIYTYDEEHYEHLAIIAYHSMCLKKRSPEGFANYTITIGGIKADDDAN